ncbi:Serine Protease Immune Response Integrator [Carabus blaptoides fortunei]
MAFKCSIIVYLCSLLLLTNSQLREGDDCLLSSEEPGKCVHLSKCKTAIKVVKNREHPVKCGFKGLDLVPLVCCSESNEIQASLSEEKCKIIPESMPKRYHINIIGGRSTVGREFPHMATLGFQNADQILWQCGGSLISEQFVLTAAHCLYSQQYGGVAWARLGDLNLTSSTDDASPVNYKIIERIPHPNYTGPATYNDIALVKLARIVTYNIYVRPACLYTQRRIEENTKLVATGWGLIDIRNTSDHLQKVTLDLFTHEECVNHFNSLANKRKLKDGILEEQQFCAGGKSAPRDTCKGDSGGPLQIFNPDDRKYYIVGITSFGKGCGLANVPSVYTRVSHFLPWMESIVWPTK